MSNISGYGKLVSPMLTLKNGLATFQMNHDGDSNFAIWLYDSEGDRVDLLVNEIGPFDGSTAVGIKKAGAYLLNVEANGNWQVEIGQ